MYLTVSSATFFSSSLTRDCLASSMSVPHPLNADSASACCLSNSDLLASAALSCISRSMPCFGREMSGYSNLRKVNTLYLSFCIALYTVRVNIIAVMCSKTELLINEGEIFDLTL